MKGMLHITLGGIVVAMLISSDVDDKEWIYLDLIWVWMTAKHMMNIQHDKTYDSKRYVKMPLYDVEDQSIRFVRFIEYDLWNIEANGNSWNWNSLT